jgi:hypothetical protein
MSDMRVTDLRLYFWRARLSGYDRLERRPISDPAAGRDDNRVGGIDLGYI